MVSALEVIAVYSIWLVIAGTIGNAIAFYICLQLRKSTTFVFLAFMSLSDIISLYYWDLFSFLNTIFSFDPSILNIKLCRFFSYIQFTSLQISACLLVFMSLDRLVILLIPKVKHYFKPVYAAFVCIGCMLVFAAANVEVLIAFGEEFNVDSNTTIIICSPAGDAATAWIDSYLIYHSCMYSYIPFAILLIINACFIARLKNWGTKVVDSRVIRKKRNMTNRTVIFLTMLFIIMTLPGAIIASIFSLIIAKPYSRLLMATFTAFSSSYHAYGLIILYLTNRKFAFQLRSIVSSVKVKVSQSYFS